LYLIDAFSSAGGGKLVGLMGLLIAKRLEAFGCVIYYNST